MGISMATAPTSMAVTGFPPGTGFLCSFFFHILSNLHGRRPLLPSKI
jgi:hypothetical protein